MVSSKGARKRRVLSRLHSTCAGPRASRGSAPRNSRTPRWRGGVSGVDMLSSDGHGLAGEAVAVLAGRRADVPAEGALQGLDRPEPGVGGDLLDRPVGRLQQAAGELDALALDVLRRRGADLVAEH